MEIIEMKLPYGSFKTEMGEFPLSANLYHPDGWEAPHMGIWVVPTETGIVKLAVPLDDERFEQGGFFGEVQELRLR